MISAEIKHFVETRGMATVSSADAEGSPHLALGNGIQVLDDGHLLFENWFCQTTLRNVERNQRVAVAVMDPDSATGYKFIGSVVHGADIALLDGYTPGRVPVSDLQALTRLVVGSRRYWPTAAGYTATFRWDSILCPVRKFFPVAHR
jgi:hypothetical protein